MSSFTAMNRKSPNIEDAFRIAQHLCYSGMRRWQPQTFALTMPDMSVHPDTTNCNGRCWSRDEICQWWIKSILEAINNQRRLDGIPELKAGDFTYLNNCENDPALGPGPSNAPICVNYLNGSNSNGLNGANRVNSSNDVNGHLNASNGSSDLDTPNVPNTPTTAPNPPNP